MSTSLAWRCTKHFFQPFDFNKLWRSRSRFTFCNLNFSENATLKRKSRPSLLKLPLPSPQSDCEVPTVRGYNLSINWGQKYNNSKIIILKKIRIILRKSVKIFSAKTKTWIFGSFARSRGQPSYATALLSKFIFSWRSKASIYFNPYGTWKTWWLISIPVSLLEIKF